MRRTIKAYFVNRSNRPVNRSNRPVYRSKPVTHAILNLVYRYEPVELSFLNSNLNLTGTVPAKPDRYTGTGPRRFGRSGR